MSVQMRFSGGFQNAPVDAAHAFRALAGCEPPAPLSVAAGTLILTLCDAETNVHLAGEADTDAVREWLTFHTGAPMVAAEEAGFALGTWDALGPLDTYSIGTPEYPDHSATLIVECKRPEQNGAVLSGLGIRGTAQLSLPDAAVFQGVRCSTPWAVTSSLPVVRRSRPCRIARRSGRRVKPCMLL